MKVISLWISTPISYIRNPMRNGLLLFLLFLSVQAFAGNPDTTVTRGLDSLCTDNYLLSRAEQYGLFPGEINRPEILYVYEQWRHVPYRYGGRGEKGLDCSGFVNVILREVYNQQMPGGSASMYTKVQRIKKEELQEGDLVFFRIYRGRISHVGMYLSNNKFVHASTRGGIMISDLNEPYYRRYWAGAGRMPNGYELPAAPSDSTIAEIGETEGE